MRPFGAWAARGVAWVMGFGLAMGVALAVQAGTLTKPQVEALFPPPLLVGEKDADLPVWPVYRRSGSGPVLQHQVFETIDLEPAPGYSGKPINLLVVLDADGQFTAARLVSHFEPIFRSEAGTAVLNEFAAQYQGLTVNHNVQVLTAKAQRNVGAHSAILHGIVAGTVTALAIDRSLLESAAQVAQAQAARAAGAASGAATSARAPRGGADDRYTRTGWNALAAARLVQPLLRSNREIEAAFRGTPGERLDAEGVIRPDAAALDLWFALASLPQAGRNLLDAAQWREVRALREAGTPVLLAIDGGRYRLARAGAADALGSITLGVEQNGRRFALRELPLRPGLRLSGQRSGVAGASTPRFFAIDAAADGTAFELLAPLTLQMSVQRQRSDGTPVAVSLAQRFEIPDAAAWRPVRETPRWLEAWQQRSADLAILGAALGVLAFALVRQRRLVATPQRLARFRVAFLLFTLVWIGWIAQGQLTIVTVTALAEALAQGRSLEFLLADPLAVVLWAATGLTLLVWGRGTFCGWLCPFGALQELLARAAALVGWQPRPLRRRTDAALKKLKYAVLAALLAAAAFASPWTEALVEVEPFKTAISLHFQREWPYVLGAALALAASVAVFRGYCRYVCPLGAALALLARVRLLAWIPRRAACGSPCQTCRHRCAYQSIAPSGRIDYAECFQCLDCVAIHDDARRCLPLIRERRGRVVALQSVPALHGEAAR
ncbi:MAG: 4Fe-4S binding protein [Burkholderiaceae bacterium]